MVYDGDFDLLEDYISAIKALTLPPDEVRFFCSGPSERIANYIQHQGSSFSFESRVRNDGFNKSLNLAVCYATANAYEWLITMTVRCKPSPNWIECLDLSNQSTEVGMITTLVVNEHERNTTFNFGHNVSPAGGCYDYGNGLPKNVVVAEAKKNPHSVIGPCTGAGIYRTIALINNGSFVDSGEIVNPASFKSYNCDAVAYFILANGYKNKFAFDAVSYKCCLKTSTSNNPSSLAINMNQEVSRLANVLTYFEDWQGAIERYKKERLTKRYKIEGQSFDFVESDILIFLFYARAMTRNFTKHRIKAALSRHTRRFDKTKAWMKGYKAALDQSSKEQAAHSPNDNNDRGD